VGDRFTILPRGDALGVDRERRGRTPPVPESYLQNPTILRRTLSAGRSAGESVRSTRGATDRGLQNDLAVPPTWPPAMVREWGLLDPDMGPIGLRPGGREQDNPFARRPNAENPSGSIDREDSQLLRDAETPGPDPRLYCARTWNSLRRV